MTRLLSQCAYYCTGLLASIRKMPVNCGACGQLCSEEEELVKCVGGCGSVFHQKCVQMKTRGAKKDWLCESCRTDKSSVSNASGPTSNITKGFLISTLESFKSEMISEFKQYSAENAELRTSVQFLSDGVDKNNTLMDCIKKELQKIQEENRTLRKENAELRGNMNHLEMRLRNLEQHSRKQNIEINGLPETRNEDIQLVLNDVAKAIGVEMKTEKIVAAHRVPSFNKKRTPPIIVRFSTYDEKDTWITKFKECRPLTANKVNPSFESSVKVFINEHLSPENKILLSKAKEVARAKGYQYVWSRDGKIFVRKENGEKCRKIEFFSDLDKL